MRAHNLSLLDLKAAEMKLHEWLENRVAEWRCMNSCWIIAQSKHWLHSGLSNYTPGIETWYLLDNICDNQFYSLFVTILLQALLVKWSLVSSFYSTSYSPLDEPFNPLDSVSLSVVNTKLTCVVNTRKPFVPTIEKMPFTITIIILVTVI